MGVEYLSEAAVFACDSCEMEFKAIEPANTKAKYKGRKLLTWASVLVPKADVKTCPFLPYSPPCPCVMVVPLRDTVIHCAAMNLLTMKAKAVCTAGQIVKPKPKQSGTDSHVWFGQAAAANVASISYPKQGAAQQESARFGKAPQANIPAPQADIRMAAAPGTVANAAVSVKNEACPGADNTFKGAKTVNPEIQYPPRQGILCSYSAGNPKCLTCEYYLDNDNAVVDNNSRKLKENYESAASRADEYDAYFNNTVVPLGDGKANRWRYAAHHIISGNQVFKHNEELVRLARFCGYDINAYENCIMLVGYPEDYPDSERMKSVAAYDVMSEGRVQWHVGGHSYTFADAAEKEMICRQIGIRNKIKINPADIKAYAELVQEEINRLTYRLENKKNRQTVCFADPQAKRQLRDKLNRVSGKIKDKLAAFTDEGKPHHSFPFYVSKEAYRFTYGLPRTGKVITVLKESGRVILTKYRLERFTEVIADRERNLLIKPGETRTFAFADQSWQHDCIVFCDNVSFFVYLDDTPRDVLPFAVERERQFPPDCRDTGRDGRRFLEEHNTELLVWLRDASDPAYVSPAVMVRKRLNELDESVG